MKVMCKYLLNSRFLTAIYVDTFYCSKTDSSILRISANYSLSHALDVTCNY